MVVSLATFFVVLLLSTLSTFSDTLGRPLASLLATFDVEFNDIFWRHLTASNTQVYNDVWRHLSASNTIYIIIRLNAARDRSIRRSSLTLYNINVRFGGRLVATRRSSLHIHNK